MSIPKGYKHVKPRNNLPIDRKTGNLQTGAHSEIVKKLASCTFCPIRNVCDKHKNLTDKEYQTGCQDVRELHLAYLKAYGKPEAVLIATMAEIETKMKLQEMIDGSQQKIITPQYLALMKMKKEFIDLIFKYGKGTKNVTEVIVRREQDIIVNPEAYAIHTNNRGTEEGSTRDLPTDE